MLLATMPTWKLFLYVVGVCLASTIIGGLAAWAWGEWRGD